jgi:Fe-S cluster biogenesis protein NfuA
MGVFTFLRRPKSTEAYLGSASADVQNALRDLDPYVRSHGGHIDLVSVSPENDVKIRLRGACQGCPMSEITFRQGIERHLRDRVPSIGKIEQVL